MKKKVFIVSSGPRNNGNSDILAEEFAKGAREAGHEVEKVNVRDMDLKFCIGCLVCQKTGRCVLRDEMNSLYDKVQNSDVLVFATPVYYYEMSGQLKTFLDRLNPLYPKDNKFAEVYLLASAAENDDSAMDGAVSGVQSWLKCFDKAELKGVVRGIGLNDRGEAAGSEFAVRAYEMGFGV